MAGERAVAEPDAGAAPDPDAQDARVPNTAYVTARGEPVTGPSRLVPPRGPPPRWMRVGDQLEGEIHELVEREAALIRKGTEIRDGERLALLSNLHEIVTARGRRAATARRKYIELRAVVLERIEAKEGGWDEETRKKKTGALM